MSGNTFWVAMLGASVAYYDAKEMRTRCLEAGTGEPLIMLHGSGGHAEAYARNVVPLSEHFHVYAVDMAGHGFTDRHPTLSGIEAIADHVLRFMDTLGIQRSHLAGESLGGATAAKIALDHPERVNKIVYITGAGLQMGEEADKLAAAGREAFQRLSAAAFGNPTRETVRARLGWRRRGLLPATVSSSPAGQPAGPTWRTTSGPWAGCSICCLVGPRQSK